MDVLTPVEKLILLRKKYKINQKDLAGDKMSRSHLAMIETGKNYLNEHTAITLVENFNLLLKGKGIDDVILLEDLMETKEMQIEKLKNSFLEKLKDNENLESTVTQIESYVSEYDMQTKISLYIRIGDLFNENENYHRAASFYLRIINDLIIIRDLDRLGKISLGLIRIYIRYENFMAAVDLENLIKSEVSGFSMPEKAIMLYNFGFIYDNLKSHQKALAYFDEVEKIVNNKDKLFDIKNLQALSLTDLGQFEKAISIYRSLMLKYKSPREKLIINDNLLYISKISNDLEKTKFYYRKCKNLIKEQLSNDTFEDLGIEQALFTVGEISLKLKKNKDACYFFSELCNEKSLRNIEVKFKAIKELLLLYNKKDIDTVLKLEKFYFDLLEREVNLTIGFEFISFYSRENLKEELDSFLEKIKEFY